jgi:hypothetical protein
MLGTRSSDIIDAFNNHRNRTGTNMSAEFTLYARECVPFGGLPSEHTYVGTSDGENFNCFGGYSDGRAVRKATGSSKWAKLIYGNYEGCGDGQPAAGLRVRYDGVCQIASNRVLVLTGDTVDARGTKGNVLATLLYGKLGFNIEPYIETVQKTADQLMQSNPGEIQPSDVKVVLDRIAFGQTPDAELDLLHADIQEQENITLPEITDDQRNAFRPIYADYQNERKAAFLEVANAVPYGTEIACAGYPKRLVQPLAKCVGRLVVAVGPDQFKNMFGVTPDTLAGKFAGFQ